MTLNPELRRHFLLDLTPQRLVLAPLVYGIAVALLWRFKESLEVFDYVAFFFLVFLGPRAAAASIADEVREGTWDWQRMSVSSASAMTGGKLFGGAAFNWYAGGLALAIPFAFGSPLAAAEDALRLVLLGLSAQGLALATALASLYRWRPTRRVPTTFCQIVGLGVALLLDHLISGLLHFKSGFTGDLFGDVTVWYGWSIGTVALNYGLAALFTIFALLAAQRLMRRELQYPTVPWGWPVFALVFGASLGGIFFDLPEGPFLIALTIGIVGLAGTYIAVFFDRKSPAETAPGVRADRLAVFGGWFPIACFTLVAGFSLIVWSLGRDLLGIPWLVLASSLALQLLLTTRDIGIVLGNAWSPAGRRAETYSLVYLGLLYVLLPSLFWVFDLKGVSALLLPPLLPIVSAPPLILMVDVPHWLAVGGGTIQAAAGLLYAVLRRQQSAARGKATSV